MKTRRLRNTQHSVAPDPGWAKRFPSHPVLFLSDPAPTPSTSSLPPLISTLPFSAPDLAG